MNYEADNNALGQLKSAVQAIAWIDNYCRANPLHEVTEGSRLLMRELSDHKKSKRLGK